uniref:Major facilitator superfamily (MFS) profile domain-containing protein n=1 Tax=Ciona intestinalis TaxID=7719 RepID=H2XQ39_CIOIN
MRVHIKMNLFERDFLLNKNGHRTENKGEGKYWTKEARKTWVVYLFVLTSILFAARVAMPVCATAISIEFGWNKADLGAVMGSLLCGGVGSILLEHYGWKRVFQVLGLISLSWTYFMWTSTRKRQNTVISLDSMVYSQPIVPPSSDSVPWQIIFSKSQVWAVIFAHFCMNNCFFILLSWLPTFFHERFPN